MCTVVTSYFSPIWMLYWCFLHDRPWISPWIKSIYNELDSIIHVIASQLSRYCDVFSDRLWRHQQNEDRASETRGRYLKIVVFIVIYKFAMSCKNKILYVLSWRTVSAVTRVLFLCLFRESRKAREINRKITLSWALKQFVIRVHTLFSIYLARSSWRGK